MKESLKEYFNSVKFERLMLWNIALFLIIKLVLPHPASQFATLIETTPTFDPSEIITATNDFRINNNLPPLKTDSRLNAAAMEKLRDMAINEYFAHISPSGVDPWFWIKKEGYDYSIAGENLAMGFLTAQDTIQAWINSPLHKNNLLNDEYRNIGVAAKAVEIDNNQGILVVQMFGASPKPKIIIVPSPSSNITEKAPLPIARQIEDKKTAQYVSTDASIEPMAKPAQIVFNRTADTSDNLLSALNRIFAAYLSAVALLSMLVFLLIDRTKKMAVKASFNMGLLVLTVTIPVWQLKLTGLIF